MTSPAAGAFGVAQERLARRAGDAAEAAAREQPDGAPASLATLGHDFARVRIHADEEAARKSDALHARAFTRGADIYFGRGQYRPGTPSGLGLLAHELTHVAQQAHLPAGDMPGLPLQCESLVSDGEYFLFVGAEDSEFRYADLIGAVRRRYGLDGIASRQLAAWLNERHGVLYDRSDRRYGPHRIRVPMPRAVAFFVVDWIEPYNPFVGADSSGARYRIGSAAFDHAQEIWARENVFVGFRPGRGLADPALREVEFEAATNADATPRLNSPADLALLAQRPSGELPEGFFHIMVTGSTSESASAAGKSVRSSERQPLTAANEGILLFAEVYAREGYRQRAAPTSTEPELGELLAHEIGHFLFSLSHSDLEFDESTGGFVDVPHEGIMDQGHTGLPAADERFDTEDRRDMEEAFRTGNIPRPERATRRPGR